MADEIQSSFDLNLTNNNVRLSRSFSFQSDQSTARYASSVQNIGTTQEAITIPSDIATPGFAYFINQSATNYVEIGLVVSATFYPFLKLKPGEGGVMRLATGTIYGKANTAACDVEFSVCAD